MRLHYSASALALVASSVLAQDCPPGYEKSKISWYKCPVAKIPTLQCSTLEVPLDYSKPSGDILKLRLVRVPASSANARNRSIIYNPGGPGAGGIESLIDNGNGLNTQKLVGNDFHIVSFDPRGTGLSIPFGCPSLDRTRDYKDTDSNIQRIYNALSLQSDKCAEPTYKDLNALMGTAYVARDIKAIAEALGEDDLIRYIGYSYGTLLGATTAAMFPNSIDRMVLDGNINPTDYYYGLGAEAVADFDKAVARFFDLCAEAGPANCAIAVAGQTGNQLRQRYDNFLSNLTYAQSYVVRGQFFDSLYGPSSFKNRAVSLRTYYNNTGRIPRRSLNRRADDDGEEEDEWEPTDSAEADTPQSLQGITCGDWIVKPAGSVASFKEWLGEFQSTSRYGGDQSLLTTLYQCSLWKNDAKEKFTGSFTNVKTKNPILFVNTQYDPVTPLISAQNSSAGFLNSRLLVSTGGGHCSTAQPSAELDAAIKQYFIDASFPSVNKIYDPDRPNAFITPPANTTVAVKRKRHIAYPDLFKDKSALVRRQTTIPVGCVKKNSTSSSSTMSSATRSNSTMSMKPGYGGYPGSSSTPSAGYGDYPGGSISSGRSSTRSPMYDGYPRPSSSSKRPLSTTFSTGSVSSAPCITKTITEITRETITKCSGTDNYCQVGSVITKTRVSTTVVTVAASPSTVIVTVKSSALSAPGQVYNVPQTSNRQHISRPASSSAPAVYSPAYDTFARAPSSAPIYKPAQPSGSAAIPPSVSRATNNVSTVPTNSASIYVGNNGTRSSGTPTGWYPAQFTGAAATDRAVLSFVAFVVAFTSFAFIL